ncbi:MAG: DNA-directed RNA polymerase, beta subunit/140 kD subunit [Chloroflexi bacterium AL-W]|nr:DNA-directed RNA polymerase, beta subunit/140 kD subunit [Chloroflexi bacterium AL-N1]NOK67934.1 DNA-directed RNA polymerase, beta subunit/140 kD subunit [Chloroflexi bacterium AL-N10]NOK73274.1 DNA-directed RNA polymerase, beta subunit/140 kD subunit [Chloroflexi bacterium AL-N5]NOK83188.1 DNA-directed RNA polymerase, beta subunit/140 kD subunit [Chloroflexi bacterium AL-W]NOK87605.1 DNA-directed RNA polymerase, beta subunit/140 kD subunit [Chloroflexi bacterium AL-N15]
MPPLTESVVLQPLIVSNDSGTDRLQRKSSRMSFARIQDAINVPTLIETQTKSFGWFRKEGLRELFDEISPITDFTGKNMELRFLDYTFGEPRYDEYECRERDITFAAPLRVNVQLRMLTTGELKESEIFLGDFPLMTENGTFVINGAERVVVSQLIRSPGVYFKEDKDPTSGRGLHSAKLIPNRGAWLEFETNKRDVVSVKVDRKRKIPVTILLRAVTAWKAEPNGEGQWVPDSELDQHGHDEHILEIFQHLDVSEHDYIRTTLDRDPSKHAKEALMELYKRLRPGDPPTLDNARSLLESLLFNSRRYDLAKVGRYKLNKNLWEKDSRYEVRTQAPDIKVRVLLPNDIYKIVERIILLNDSVPGFRADDIDHLGNRRVRTVGELIQQQFRVGLLRMERVIKERMSLQDSESATPNALINIRPVVAAMREFFGGSQLSQFMDQTNPLAELTNKRRLSALGPGGLSRDRAGFEVRDVHHSHYGRICPVETPEGPNIGLIGTMSTFSRVNEMGFLETPYRKVYREVPNASEWTRQGLVLRDVRDIRTGELIAARGTRVDEELGQRIAIALLRGQILREDIINPETDEVIAEAEQEINRTVAEKIIQTPLRTIKIRPVVSQEVDYLSADEEEQFIVVQANAPLDKHNRFERGLVSCHFKGDFIQESVDRVDYMDVSPKQVVSVSTALIPFLEHDDANRALMGSNMQRQAVPLLRPDPPIVGTGMEYRAARDSGQVAIARQDGVVLSATGEQIVVLEDTGGERTYRLRKFTRSNQDTCINQRPSVQRNQRVRTGEIIADSSSTGDGELALGQNVLVAFMPWEGGNFEDAILVSERLVREDIFTSIHIEKYEVEARDTKLGPEEITRDIPNVGQDSLRNLDDRGIIYVGAEVQPNDILVGKITPKGETDLTAEERLLRAIFGEKAREVKDSSLRVPNGVRGKVIDVKVFAREEGAELPVGVNQIVRVMLCQKRKISAGDKMAGRHGNKGVVSRVLPIEDMPFLPDGTPVDIILNPIGVPSRMNIGQILETHLGWAAARLGTRVATPVFDGATELQIKDMLEQSDLPRDGKITLYDGRSGQPFDHPVTVGYIYMLKLAHLVEDKIHARSTGPYSLVTQQPLGGKAQFGGQRFGEMEVWALEAYGAAYILQEMLTVKSDDVVGRVKTYEAIVKGEPIQEAGVPESFKVLIKELQSLGLSVEVLSADETPVELTDDADSDLAALDGINLSGMERGEM